MKSLIGAVVGACCLAAPALAESPAAIVEDVQGKVDGVAFMDYVAPGKIIKLGPKATITLSYVKSCQRETISEGVVMVGTEQSTVQLGEVKRKGTLRYQRGKTVGARGEPECRDNLRTMRSDAKGSAPAKLPTLYGVAPLVQAKSGSTLVIERTDGKEPTISVPLKGETMVGGKFYDFARAGKSLTPGGSYLAILGGSVTPSRSIPAPRRRRRRS